MTTLEIFREFEAHAIVWGLQHNRFAIGDIVEAKLIGNKKPQFFRLSGVSVVVGRNAQKTTYKSFTLRYVGRRLYKDGTPKEEVGTGIWLKTFRRVSDGLVFEANFNGVNQTINDCGLSFQIAYEEEAKKLYPNAYRTYTEAKDFPYFL